jgi:exopolysaccharide biosynthesis polyprenyl glycosylphosphotransferase
MRPIDSLRESSTARGPGASHPEPGTSAGPFPPMFMTADFGEVEPATGVASQFPEFPLLLAQHRPWREWEALLKRAMDLVVAGLLILCAAPVMFVIAIIIKLTSSGSVIFRQKRVGFEGNVFEILKFRTMYAHLADPLAERQSCKQDERVTRFGRLLRRTSLDELPQFLNVLAGDMSLVGPRPHALGTTANGIRLELADPRYDLRHRAKPGITGWAQVNGCRGAVTTVDQVVRRVDYDLYYIENWSLALDLKIICRTALLMLTDRDVP